MSLLPEPGATSEFVTWYRKSGLLRMAYFLTRDAQLAEDIAQEAAVKVWKAWPDDRKRILILTHSGYVRAIVQRCFLDHIRARARMNTREVELDIERNDRPNGEIDHDLRRAVLSLDGDGRDMILLRYYNGLTTKEAGSQLGLSKSQAYRLHDKALAHLAELLDEGEA
jgi:RNA polymerase sigma factor (sigma-70 family)